jgi:hypothetical protein
MFTVDTWRLLPLLALAACRPAPNPCDGKPAMCVALEVKGPFDDLDRLDGLIQVPGGAALHGEESAAAPIRLPVQFAALLPDDVAGTITVEMVGTSGKRAVAYGSATVAVPPSNQRVAVTLSLIVRDDGGAARDLHLPGAGEDLARPVELADLSRADGARPVTDGDAAADDCLHVDCNLAPSPSCVGPATLRSFAAPGSCSGGTCSYGHVDANCAGSCQSGACVGGPCTAAQCMDRQCGMVPSLGCDCGGCSAETWCDVYCGETTCQDNLCCLPAGSSCDPSQDFLYKACCPGTFCLSGVCSAN